MDEDLSLSRKITKQRFLETESRQLQTYLHELSTSLSSSKFALQQILTGQVAMTSKSRSLDTETNSSVSIKLIEQAVAHNLQLFSTLRNLKYQRDSVQGHAQ